MQAIISLFGTIQMQIIVILLAADLVLGIIAALVKKNFAISKVALFMKGPVLGYILGFAVLEIVGQVLPFLSVVVSLAFILIVIALLGSVLKNLNRLGLPLPKLLKR